MTRFAAALAIVVAAALPLAAQAEPYLAVERGLKCLACHVNATGAGLRNSFGVAFAQTAMPARTLPAGTPNWTGSVGDFFRLGGDLRAAASRTEVPTQATRNDWRTEELRLYANVRLIADRLDLYIDEALAPGAAQLREASVRYSGAGWYLRGGQFYLPFGWRLQDDTALVREASGINMANPDNGVEFGIEGDEWSAQLALTKGPGNAGGASGHQLTGQLVWVKPFGRIGVAAASTNSAAGDREAAALFGGLRTGPLVWIGELDFVRDAGFPEGRRKLLAALGEVNWRPAQGHNLKLTGEYFDPDRDVRENHKVRQSVVYEYTPLPFVQLRLGWRRHRGIPQINLDNRRLTFVELHGFF